MAVFSARTLNYLRGAAHMVRFDRPTTPDIVNKGGFRLPSSEGIADKGKVQLGGQGPVFRASQIADKAKVRLGGQSPNFRK